MELKDCKIAAILLYWDGSIFMKWAKDTQKEGDRFADNTNMRLKADLDFRE